MNPVQISQSLEKRYATKVFDPQRKISDEYWKVLERALHIAPSGYGLQPWKFLVIQDTELRKRLTPASLGQAQIEDCSHLVVFASKTYLDEAYIESHIDVVANARHQPKENFQPYYKMMVEDLIRGPKSKYICEWAACQAYIALGTLLTTAALLGLDSCALEGIEREDYDEILQIKNSGYRTLVGCALGYRNPDDKYATYSKARFDKNQIFQYL